MTRARKLDTPAAHAASAGPKTAADDTASRRLTPAERSRLDIDGWEPSLLHALLEAHNRLPTDKA